LKVDSVQNPERPADTIQSRLRRGVWVILVLFVLSTAGAFAVFRATGTTSQYTTIAVVAPPGSVTNPAEALQYVGDFRAALASDVVAQRSAKATGIGASKLQQRLDSKRASLDSAIINVTYTTDHADANSEKVVGEVVNQASAFLSKGRAAATVGALTSADKSVAAANEDATKADATVSDFLSKNGGVEPTATVTALQGRIIDLDVTVAQANADGNLAAAAAASRSRDALTQDLATARSLATQIAPLTQAADAAHQRVADAEKARTDALSAVADDKGAVQFAFSKVNSSVSQTQAWLRQAIAVGAAVAILAALVIAWLPAGTLARRRSGVRRTPTPGSVAG
jgi:hypothetical protein